MQFSEYLKALASRGGSDLYLSVGCEPRAKFHGQLENVEDIIMTPQRMREIAKEVMTPAQQQEFDHELEMNLAISEPGVGRFRINIFKQRNEISMVIRNIVTDIPNVNQLGLPKILLDVIMAKRGLILFVGGTGSGKSTSLAALIDHRNTNSGGHIITIEDPVEFVHSHKKSIVNQREVGMDTQSFHHALKNTLRQAPDVILIGEIRDRETMEHALAFAETGHLAISTLHANNANQALDRIINFFPEEKRPQLLHDLSNNLRAFVSQRLIPTVEGKRCAAIEILLGTSTIQELIKRGDLHSIKEVMEKSEAIGMQTFDRALFKLYMDAKITLSDALKNADSPNNLRLMIKLANNGEVPEVIGQPSAKPAAAPTEESTAEPEEKSSFGGGLTLELEAKEEEEEEEEDIGIPPPAFVRPK